MKTRMRWTIRAVVGVILALYLVTGVMGVPAVRASVKKDFDAKVLFADDRGSPYLGFSWTFPILPFVILSKHDYQIGGLNGQGGFYFYLWYPGHVRLLKAVITLIS